MPGPRDRTHRGYLVRENPWVQLQGRSEEAEVGSNEEVTSFHHGRDTPSLDQFGVQQQAIRDGQTERIGYFQIDDQVKFCCELHRQIIRSGAT